MKPLIGITPSFSSENDLLKLNIAYSKAVTACGGIPIILSYTGSSINHIFDYIDGIIFSGGGDIDPLLFYEEPNIDCGQIYPERDFYELSLCRFALAMNIPILGICRGMQIMSVAMRGSIHQDIYSFNPSAIKHSQSAPKNHPTHNIKIQNDSVLSNILGCDYLTVNSFHHQSVNDVGKNFIASAFADDSIIEGIEHTKNTFAVGVQWHPEHLYEKNRANLNIFKGFVAKCK